MVNLVPGVSIALVHGRKQGSNTVEIRIYFRQEQKQVYISTGVSVPPKAWNMKLKVINPSIDYVSKQEKINDLKYRIEYILQKLEYYKKEISKELFMAEFKGEATKSEKKPELLYQFCTRAIERSNISTSSKKSQRHTAVLLKEFSAFYSLVFVQK